MKKIKVAQIVPMLGPGGAERVAVHIVRGLNPQRYEVAVISIWRRVGCDLEQILDDFGTRVEYLGKGKGFDGRTYHKLHRVLREFRPDIVHTHLQVLRYALPSLFLLRNMLALHTVHNLAQREVEPRARCIQSYALGHGVVPVAVSEEVAHSVKQLYGLKECRVIPNGIPTTQYANPQIERNEWRAREGFSENDVLFTCVARFARQKNHSLLLKTFAQGPGANPSAHLVLIGDGDLRESLQEQAKGLGLTRQIHFLGLRTDVPDALGASDVFVLSSDYEGNPLSVMEAMASGLPVVCTAAGGVPDLLTNGKEGLLHDVGDAEGLAGSMTFVLANPQKRHAMGAAAALRAKANFDVSKMVHDYEQLYEEMIDTSHRARVKSSIHSEEMSLQD